MERNQGSIVPLRSDDEMSALSHIEFIDNCQEIAQRRWNCHLDRMMELDRILLDKIAISVNDLRKQEWEGYRIVEGKEVKVCKCNSCSHLRQDNAEKLVELHNEITRDYDGGQKRYEVFREGKNWDIKMVIA